jgi:hypothetical protein
LKTLLLEFKENIPIVMALNSPYLTETHIQELYAIVGKEIPLKSEDFILE